MNAEEMKTWLAVILGALALLGHLKGYFSSGEKKIAEDLKELQEKAKEHDTKLEAQAQRLQAAESELRHLPSKDDVAALRLSLAELTGTVGVLAEGFKGVSSTVHNIDNWLREKGSK